MDFKNSRFYGSRVEQAKSERGWLPRDEFIRLGRQEFQDYRRGFTGGPGNVSVGGIGKIVILIVAALGVLSLFH
jgi:hypothetical protein